MEIQIQTKYETTTKRVTVYTRRRIFGIWVSGSGYSLELCYGPRGSNRKRSWKNCLGEGKGEDQQIGETNNKSGRNRSNRGN